MQLSPKTNYSERWVSASRLDGAPHAGPLVLERERVIETPSLAWKARALPLSYSRNAADFRVLVGAAGFEPATSASQTLRANQAALRPEAPSIASWSLDSFRALVLVPAQRWAAQRRRYAARSLGTISKASTRHGIRLGVTSRHPHFRPPSAVRGSQSGAGPTFLVEASLRALESLPGFGMVTPHS